MLQFFRKKNIAHQSRKRTFTFIALLGFNAGYAESEN
jgi:hypothetical protein